MARKRTSLEALLDEPEPVEPTPLRPRQKALATPKRTINNRPIKQQTVYLPIPVYEQLRRLAFDEREKMHTLIMEGLDRVFRDRGLRSLAELERESA
jgi:hypothetical protein